MLPLVVALLSGVPVTAQFMDDFTDGDFTSDPAWGGDAALFTVDEGRLRSNTGALSNATTYALSTPSTWAANAQWEFFVDLKFATSGANYVDLYLLSDVQDLSAPANGYFVRIGGISDQVCLYSMVAGTAGQLITGPEGIVNSSTDNPFRIKVTRDAADQWTLFYDDGASGTYFNAGSAINGAITASAYFGIRIVQSTAASVVNGHYFDDISVGPIVQDTAPPTLMSAIATDDVHVDLLFSEPLDQATAEGTGNYALQPTIAIGSAGLDGTDPARVHLTLASALQNGATHTVIVNGVQDLAGNAIANGTAEFTYSVPSPAARGDVVINELMPDPDPPVELPNAEFVELFNTTDDRSFDLTGWTITDGGSTGTIPSVQLQPGGYIILTGTSNAPLFAGSGTTVGIPSFPSLNNDGDPLVLFDADGTLIDTLTYSSAWYADAAKAAGGWSLERIDPYTPCSGALDWSASLAPSGGTPGAQNSVFDVLTDTVPPMLVQAFAVDGLTVDLLFNEAMDATSLAAGGYAIDPVMGIATVAVIAVDRVRLTLSEAMEAGVPRTITVAGVTDCTGNPIGAANVATFTLPEPIAPGDVVINEVLYDPIGFGSDFVELYNRSQKVVSLAGSQLVNGSGSSALITADPYPLLPGQYVAIATDAANVLSNYPMGHAERMLEAPLPSFVNGSGRVTFLGATGDTLDLFNYSDDLQFPLLKGVDGVSLERVDPDRPAGDDSNWHSAAEAVGFATPGYRNSQYAPAPAANGSITIDPAIFSPDNDGHQDVLTIGYRFDEPGFVATVKVFDIAGREVRTLMNNELLGTSGAVSWDGMMEANDLARIGPYIIYFEAYDLQGNVEKFRKSVVLAHKL